jgi:NAD(P)-dependent dehydrogenase (short-subunit alcohol dehydrogenase family)
MNILVTGGNRGIGKEICRQLTEQGHLVFLGSRKLDQAKLAVEEIRKSTGSKTIYPLKLDVNNSRDIKKAIAIIHNTSGVLDVLINNAGILPNSDDIEELEIKDLEQTMATNFYGPLMLTKAAIPLLKQSKNARIINVSSGMGSLYELASGYAAYRLSKTAINGLTNVLAADLAKYGIESYAVCPGWVKTDMGGAGAPRPVSEGAHSIICMLEGQYQSGRFYRDGKMIHW